MRAQEQARAFVPGDADQQLGIVGIDDVGAKNAVVGGFLAQLVSFAGKHPDERVEPEERSRDTREEELDPVEPRNVRKLVRNDGLRFVGSFDRTAVEQNYRSHQAPADGRSELVAGEKRGSVLEAHSALGAGKGT